MTAFLIVALLLAVGAALAVTWPLLRSGEEEGKGRSWLGPALLLLLPAAAGVAYVGSSDWQWDAPAGPVAVEEAPSLETLVGQLEERLRESPDDLDGWKLLGRTRAVTGNFSGAGEAFARALQLSGGDDPEAMVGYGEALVRQDASQFEGEAGRLFERALQRLPDDPRALWYGGVAAWRKQDFVQARTRWQRLRQQGGEPEVMAFLDERLAEMDAMLGPSEPSGDLPGGIRVLVELAPELAGAVTPDAMLFVLARKGERGPPLAVQRRMASELPVEIVLTDRDAMLPGTSLTGVGALRVVARISSSGQPVASTGDLFGEVAYDPGVTDRLSILIDRQVGAD
ncbi:MAG: tetratricopeptide repeat protein [Steroidobacteraceae bacterium]